MAAPSPSWWVPLLVCLAIALGTALIWFVVESDWRQELSSEAAITAQQVALRLEASLDARVHLLSQLANQIPPRQADDPTSFIQQAASIEHDYPGFQAINWIDTDYRIRLTVPETGNEAALGKNLREHPDPSVRTSLAAAAQSGHPQRTAALELLQGGLGFASYTAVRDESGHLYGFINGVFRTADLVDACLREADLRKNFRFVVVDDAGRILAHSGQGAPPADNRVLAVEFPIRNQHSTWRLRMQPTDAFIASNVGWDSRLLLLLGLIGALLVPILVRQGQLRRYAVRVGQIQFQSLFENSMDAICLTTVEGRILNVNRAAAKLFGYSADELLQQDAFTLYQDPKEREALLNILRRDGKVRSFQVKLRHRDGKILDCELNAVLSRRPWLKQPVVEGIIRDISGRREMEEILLRTQKMEALGRMAAGIAHDFNNLLAVVKGNAELAMLSIGEGGPGHVEFEEIGRATERANKLIRQLLALGKRQVSTPRIVQPDRLLLEMEMMFQRVVEPGCRVCFDLADDTAPVFIDPGQFEQMVMNLAVNAGDAMGEEGTLTFQTRNRTITKPVAGESDPCSPGEYVEISVTDTGHGISPTILDKIFDPFFTTKDRSKGTGLGLATVYGLVSQNKGSVTVESKLDQGSRFTLLLPQAPTEGGASTRSHSTAPADSAAEQTPILVVDDDPYVRNMLTRSLEVIGMQVYSADSGEAALEILTTHPEITLLVSDVMMEGIAGPELVELAISWNPRLKFLLVSGHPLAAVQKRFPEVRAEDFLQKPYTVRELQEQIFRLLNAGLT